MVYPPRFLIHVLMWYRMSMSIYHPHFFPSVCKTDSKCNTTIHHHQVSRFATRIPACSTRIPACSSGLSSFSQLPKSQLRRWAPSEVRLLLCTVGWQWFPNWWRCTTKMGVAHNIPQQMALNGKSHENGWFLGGTPILGNLDSWGISQPAHLIQTDCSVPLYKGGFHPR